MVSVLLFTAGSYLLGSIPFGLLVGKLFGVDVRRTGSGNIGTSNVLRSLGTLPAIIVLVLDATKGAVPVLFADRVAIDPLLAGLMAVVGHNWPVFLAFRGGRGVATTLGLLIAYTPLVALFLFVLWALVVTFTRYISLASIVACIALPITFALIGESASAVTVAIVLGLFGVYRHIPNIQRLLSGTEHRFGERVGKGR